MRFNAAKLHICVKNTKLFVTSRVPFVHSVEKRVLIYPSAFRSERSAWYSVRRPTLSIGRKISNERGASCSPRVRFARKSTVCLSVSAVSRCPRVIFFQTSENLLKTRVCVYRKRNLRHPPCRDPEHQADEVALRSRNTGRRASEMHQRDGRIFEQSSIRWCISRVSHGLFFFFFSFFLTFTLFRW